MPTLTQLEYIVAVDRTRHFGQAAKICHISQPTLSMQIQKAEEELGLLLFDREKQPIIPTEKGARLIEQARNVLREHEKLKAMSLSEAKEISGSCTLGIIPTLAPYLLPLFVDLFSRKYPGVTLHIDELKTEEIIHSLRNDVIDAGLLATPLHEKGMQERILFYEPFYVYLNPKHRLAARKKISEDDLDINEIWLLKDGHCFRSQIINYCTLSKGKHSAIRNVSFEGANFETLRNLIRAGSGYTLFPHLFVEGLAHHERTSCVRSFAAPVPSREVSLVQRRNHWKHEILEAMFELLKSQLPKELLEMKKNKMEIVPI